MSATSPGGIATPSPAASARIWRGDLVVRGHRNELIVPVVAEAYAYTSKPFPLDAGSWPSRLHCDAAKLKLQSQVTAALNAPDAQWYIRIVPVDQNGNEADAPKVKQMVQVLVERSLVFEIRCEAPGGTPGTLYLSGLRIPPHADALQGVFKPHSAHPMTAPLPAPAGLSVGAALGMNGPDGLGGLSMPPPLPSPLASPLQPPHIGGAEAGGRRIWEGVVQVRGHVNDMMVPCAAVQYVVDERTQQMIDASGWPFLLQCDSSALRSGALLVEQMNTAQWYVRFAAVDANGCERQEPRLVELVKVLVERKLVFEIRCAGLGGTPGMLYLWGLHIPPHGLSFLGVFRPDNVGLMDVGVEKGLQSKMEGASVS